MNTLKKLLLVTILGLGITSLTYSQNSGTGIKGGLNLSSLSTDGNNDKNLKMGLHAGVFTKIPISESFAVQPELMYSGKGIKLNYDESAIVDGETKFNLNYLDLPVKLVFNLSEDFEFQVGPYVSYLINANMNTDAEVLDYFEINSEDEINRDRFNSFDYGLTAGLMFDLDPLIFGFNYNLGFKQVAKENDLAYDFLGDAKNNVIQLYAGMKF